MVKKYLIVLVLLVSYMLSGCSSTKVDVKENPIFKYPVHFLGLISGANCNTQYQLDLFSNNTYFLREVCFKNGVASKNSDDIGRWYLDSENRLVLNGGGEVSKFFYLSDTKSVELMDLEGKQIDSKLNYTLTASNTAKTIEPQLFMQGMYSYMADSGIFKECLTGMKFHVSFEEDSIALERAYLQNKRVAGEALKVHIDGKLTLRDGMDNRVNIPTLEVRRFIKIIPKERCQNLYSEASLTNTYWKLTVLNSKAVPHTKNNRREAHMILSNGRVRGNSGCNGMGGAYTLDGDKLSFSDKGMMMTRMFCKGSVEQEFLKAMKAMQSYKIKGEYLEIFGKDGAKLARFESVYLY